MYGALLRTLFARTVGSAIIVIIIITISINTMKNSLSRKTTEQLL